jgi:oxygen-dependent protoporphyrinogen oxidase
MGKRVAVIGGGISGLAAALSLAVQTTAEVTIFEQSERFGGKLKSEHIDGFVIEGGADAILPVRERFRDINHLLGLSAQIIHPNRNHRGSFILHDGTLHPMPAGLAGLVPTRVMPMLRTGLLSPLGKFRMLLDLGLPRKTTTSEETLAEFATRRFGAEAYNNLLEPLLAGISSGEGEHISLQATYPQWDTAELESGSVIRGMMRARRQRNGATPVQGFFSYRDGVQSLADAIVRYLGDRQVAMQANTPVLSLARDTNGFRLATGGNDGTREDIFDGVIVALPAPPAATLFSGIDPAIAQVLQDIPQRSATVVSLGLRGQDAGDKLNGSGYLTPVIEGRLASAMTWSSSKWPHRAPAGQALVRVYFGRGRGEETIDYDDAALVQAAREELHDITGIDGDPVVQSVTRWRSSMPQYTIGHLNRVAAIDSAVAQYRGLAIAGNMLRGVGIGRCMITAENAASKIRTDLIDG